MIHPFLILLVGMVVVIGGILLLRLHAFLALILAALAVALLTAPETVYQYGIATGLAPAEALELSTQPLAERVAEGFGRTIGQIGIVIAMASVIGICLLESGGADRIVRTALKRFGEDRAPHVFAGSSMLLAIPVFFDTVFYLMMPLAKSMRVRTGRHYLFYILAIIAGGSMMHSLVPPTPGPLFIAGELGIDLGVMMLGGLAVGTPAAVAGFAYARWADRKWGLPLRETPDALERLKQLTDRSTDTLPSLGFALLPIILPVVLIAGSTIVAGATAGDAPEV
ncbi:MAG: SLC13 family permease, partial [Rhodothermales bacterium]